jgi:hypothetical protein
MLMLAALTVLVTALTGTANAYVAEECLETAAGGTPPGYSDQAQQDFLLNYFSLSTTLSPVHAPVPHKPGHGSVGIEAAIIPPLSCERRLVLDYTKTEDTNKAPVAPRPRIIFSFPELGKLVPYAGLAYVPPVTVFGTRNVIISGEAGVGIPFESGFSLGGRYHATLMKTIAEIATPFVVGDPAYEDFYMGSTFGVDAMAGWDFDGWEPYLALGFTDVSTFFYIGDDGLVSNNSDPYAGLTGSVGVQAKVVKHLDLAGEFYTAPGYLYTGRLRAAYRW